MPDYSLALITAIDPPPPGLIRAADIDSQNTVLSTRVANAQINYTGKGEIARASTQGWLGRFFSRVSPF